MTAALAATGLGKRYRRQWALEGCSLSIPAGHVTALVGPNGAGKTTLLLLAMGIIEPTEGSVEVLGVRPSTTSAEVLARVGFVAQDHPLYRGFTVADTLQLGARLNARWDDPAARERLARLGIPLDRRVGRLSGGQQAQVALAMALAKRPELLLLDEPIASLDPLAREEFLQVLLDAVVTDGISVVLSSHVIADLERVCDHVVLLCGGRVQVAGDIDSLLATHKRITGPRTASTAITGVRDVIDARSTERQSTLIVRTNGRALDGIWTASELTLQDLVIGYMRRPQAGALPEPELAHAEVGR
jgi:ABC-2 type transport system ATP-binding protein